MTNMHTVGYPIRAVSRRSGLSAHVIRIWEKRYAAVKPYRTPTNRRLYSEQDIERLVLLKKATLAGHNISSVASIPTEKLVKLVERSGVVLRSSLSSDEINTLNAQCLKAVENLDARELQILLTRAADALGPTAVALEVVVPILQETGERWYDGRLRVLHEHLMSAVMRSFLGTMADAFNAPADAPLLVTCTPAGQLHEFGALLASVMALSEEWRVMYLGPNLPAEEVAETVRRSGAVAVGVSLVYPLGDPAVADQLTQLRKLVGSTVPIIAGGRATGSYRTDLDEIGAIVVEDLIELPQALDSVSSQVR